MKAFWATGVCLAASAVQAQSDLPLSGTLQNILQNTHNSDLYQYPTGLTQGIVPVRLSIAMFLWKILIS